MEEQTTGCLVCGAPLEYFPSQIEMECTYCHKTFMSNARCVNGHFICDSCHEQMGLRVIEDICRHTDSKDPVAIMKKIILSPYIYMHGRSTMCWWAPRFWLPIRTPGENWIWTRPWKK